MIGILGESPSDAETVCILVRRLAQNPSLPLKRHGFDGCGELLRKGASHMRLFQRQNVASFIICHDADGPDPAIAHDNILKRVVEPAAGTGVACILVPVQEIEAWFLSDSTVFPKVLQRMVVPDIAEPERIPSPKEYIKNRSAGSNSKPRFVPSIHNERFAESVDLDAVAHKCPSFRPLREFVLQQSP